MGKPSESHIERFVRYPSELSQQEKEWIERWIDKDKEVSLLADWYREFYASVDKIEKSHKRSGSVPAVIVLKPLINRSKRSNGFVLAAQTPIPQKKQAKLKTLRTFVSEKHKTLIRILHDDPGRQSKVYVLSEFVDEEDVVLIEIMDEPMFLISQPGGTFVIPDQKISKKKIADWSQCKLHLPVSKVRIYKDQERNTLNFDTSGTDRDTQYFNFDFKENELSVTLDFGKKPLPDKLVLVTSKISLFWTIENGQCSIPLDEFTEPESHLFFYN